MAHYSIINDRHNEYIRALRIKAKANLRDELRNELGLNEKKIIKIINSPRSRRKIGSKFIDRGMTLD